MQSSDDAVGRPGLIILQKLYIDSTGYKTFLIIGFKKKSAAIAKNLWFNQDQIFDAGLDKIH